MKIANTWWVSAELSIGCRNSLKRQIVQCIERAAQTGSTEDGRAIVFSEDYTLEIADENSAPREPLT